MSLIIAPKTRRQRKVGYVSTTISVGSAASRHEALYYYGIPRVNVLNHTTTPAIQPKNINLGADKP